MIINGLLVALGTDIFKMIAIPFGFVTQLTNTWLGVMVIYFLIHALDRRDPWSEYHHFFLDPDRIS